MTREEAIKKIKKVVEESVIFEDELEAFDMAIKALEQQPCEDVISREDALKSLCQAVHKNDDNIPCPNQRVSCLWNKTKVQDYAEEILKLPSAIPQRKTGRWKRMTDLPNDVDDRFECSRCGNVVHHRNVMDLRTFSRWCGRCGSDNG